MGNLYLIATSCMHKSTLLSVLKEGVSMQM